MSRRALVRVIVVALCASGWIGCGDETAPPGRQPEPDPVEPDCGAADAEADAVMLWTGTAPPTAVEPPAWEADAGAGGDAAPAPWEAPGGFR